MRSNSNQSSYIFSLAADRAALFLHRGQEHCVDSSLVSEKQLGLWVVVGSSFPPITPDTSLLSIRIPGQYAESSNGFSVPGSCSL